MTNEEILQVAMRQSAVDSGCKPEDFLADDNKIVISRPNQCARKYLDLPFLCDLTSYGVNIVASISEELTEIVSSYINLFKVEHCFETPNLHWLMNRLQPLNINVCFMAEYFLPDADAIKIPVTCPYEIRVLMPKDFSRLYSPLWGNALCEKRKELDVIAVGAYDNGNLIALAGGSADCDSMWQIGLDVLPLYRRQGVATAITRRLANEIINRGKVPFYCSAWSNIKSVRNALKSGFKPAWIQLTCKRTREIDALNQ